MRSFLAKHSVSVAVAAAALTLGLLLDHLFSRPMLYEIPGGYKGWVVIHYEEPSCPALPGRGIFLVVTIPSTGRMCTSSRVRTGWAYTEVQYVYPDGRREPLVWIGAGDNPEAQAWLVTYNPETKQEFGFIGSQKEFKQAGRPPYRESAPLPLQQK